MYAPFRTSSPPQKSPNLRSLDSHPPPLALVMLIVSEAKLGQSLTTSILKTGAESSHLLFATPQWPA